MGISGIGKSTLTKLLMGVYPVNTGSIYLVRKDGAHIPVDKNIRGLYAYVPQGNFLLSGTIKENISFVCPDASDEDIMRAAQISCADDFIRSFPTDSIRSLGNAGRACPRDRCSVSR